MLNIFFVMLAAIIIGWFLRHRKIPRKTLSRAVSIVILILMCLIGVELGSNKEVLATFEQIFINAAVISIAALTGSIIAAVLVNKYIIKARIKQHRPNITQKKGGSWFSVMIIGAFLLGALGAYIGVLPVWTAAYSGWALYLLMALVGFNIGSDVAALEALKGQNWKVIFLPMATIVGSLTGVLAFSWILNLSLTQQLAVGSGMAYYSLSSVILTELQGAQLGAVALLANVVRELVTVIFAPILAHKISPLALISCGGATTMDITLPIVLKQCGGGFLAMSLFHGVVVDLSVPLLVTLFGMWQ